MGILLWLMAGILVGLVFYVLVSRKPGIFLEGVSQYKQVPLIDIKQISPDTKIFVFGLDSEKQDFGLPLGKHLLFRADINGEKVIRKYTPTSTIDTKGRFDALIKVYFPGVHPNFPDGGKMSQHINDMKIGDKIEISGPRGDLEYIGNRTLAINCRGTTKKFIVDHIGMVAGGTGITPCFQLIQYICENKHNVQLYLLFANKTQEDILLREKLEEYAKGGKLKLCFTLDKPSEGWTGETGFVTKEMLLKSMPDPSTNCFITHCGPGPMNQMVRQHLLDLGYKEDHILKF